MYYKYLLVCWRQCPKNVVVLLLFLCLEMEHWKCDVLSLVLSLYTEQIQTHLHSCIMCFYMHTLFYSIKSHCLQPVGHKNQTDENEMHACKILESGYQLNDKIVNCSMYSNIRGIEKTLYAVKMLERILKKIFLHHKKLYQWQNKVTLKGQWPPFLVAPKDNAQNLYRFEVKMNVCTCDITLSLKTGPKTVFVWKFKLFSHNFLKQNPSHCWWT